MTGMMGLYLLSDASELPRMWTNVFDDCSTAAAYEGWYSGRGTSADLGEKAILAKLLHRCAIFFWS